MLRDRQLVHQSWARVWLQVAEVVEAEVEAEDSHQLTLDIALSLFPVRLRSEGRKLLTHRPYFSIPNKTRGMVFHDIFLQFI